MNDIELPDLPKWVLNPRRKTLRDMLESYARLAVEADMKRWAQKFEALSEEYARRDQYRAPELCKDAVSALGTKRIHAGGIMQELKPCPFCESGGEPVKINQFYPGAYIMCVQCMCQTQPYKEIQDAVEKWNRRSPAFDAQQWKLVPMQPTEEMFYAGRASFLQFNRENFDSDIGVSEYCKERAAAVFRAMLNAAPKPGESES